MRFAVYIFRNRQASSLLKHRRAEGVVAQSKYIRASSSADKKWIHEAPKKLPRSFRRMSPEVMERSTRRY